MKTRCEEKFRISKANTEILKNSAIPQMIYLLEEYFQNGGK